MNIRVEMSDNKKRMMGEAAALLFKLKAGPDGLYRLRAGQTVSKLGMAETVMMLVSETLEFTEKELEEFLIERRQKA